MVAPWDAQSEELTSGTRPRRRSRSATAWPRMLGLAESQVRVVAPFIGGGFGPKIMMFYPEEVLVPWAAMRLGRPVKWIEDRLENFVATTQERGQVHDAEMALTRDGRILGVRDVFLHDTGAYDPYGLTVPINSQCTLLGAYRVPAYDSEFTRRLHQQADRDAGARRRPPARRLRDGAAARPRGARAGHRPGRDPPPQLPRARRLPARPRDPLPGLRARWSTTAATTCRRSSRRAEMIGYERFVARGAAAARGAEGRHVGIGIVSYVEGTGIGPYEGARVTVEPSGKVRVATGVGTQGQGHFTAFAQIVADVLGVDVATCTCVTGDTREFHWGTGTFASRGAVVAGSACHAAALARAREGRSTLAGGRLEAAESSLELAGGTGARRRRPRPRDRARRAGRAGPIRCAAPCGPGTEPGLEATAYFGPDRGSTASGVHAMIVEVDPETAMVQDPALRRGARLRHA